MSSLTEKERARFRQSRHRCNGCGTIFDCVPCKHMGPEPVFCKPECEETQKPSEGPARGTVYESYLKHAGLSASSGSRKPRHH